MSAPGPLGSWPTKAWSRAGFAWFDAIWERLDRPARRLYVEQVAAAEGYRLAKGRRLPKAGRQLVEQGLAVEVPDRAHGGRFVVPSERARDFARRLHALQRFPVLRDPSPGRLAAYLEECFDEERLRALLAAADEGGSGTAGQLGARGVVDRLADRVGSRRWIVPALRRLDAPARSLLLDLTESGAVPLSQLHAEAGEDALEGLLGWLLAFEGLDPATLQVVAGPHPSTPGVVSGLRPGADAPAPAAEAAAARSGIPGPPEDDPEAWEDVAHDLFADALALSDEVGATPPARDRVAAFLLAHVPGLDANGRSELAEELAGCLRDTHPDRFADVLVSVAMDLREGRDPSTLTEWRAAREAARGSDGTAAPADRVDPAGVPPAEGAGAERRAGGPASGATEPGGGDAGSAEDPLTLGRRLLPAPPDPPPEMPDARPPLLDDVEDLLARVAERELRVRVDGLLYKRETSALVELLGRRAWPFGEPLRRLRLALQLAQDLGLLSRHERPRGDLLGLGEHGRAWLERTPRERFVDLLEALRQRPGEALPGPLVYLRFPGDRHPPGFTPALARSYALAPLLAAESDRFYRLDDLTRRCSGGDANPLHVFEERYWQAMLRANPHRAPGSRLAASRVTFMRLELSNGSAGREEFDAVYPGVVEHAVRDHLALVGGTRLATLPDGTLAFALTEHGRWLLGARPDSPDEPIPGLAPAGGDGRVLVQPNLEVQILGHAPAAVTSLARFAVRQGPAQGPASTLHLTREGVIDAVDRGLTPEQILAALEAAASHEVPQNVLRTVGDWARSVRRVRVRHVPVLVCDDEETALEVASHAGKSVLPGFPVPVLRGRLGQVQRTLRKQGVLVEDDDASS